MSQLAIQNLIEIVRNETELHANTKERIASLLTLLNSEKMDRSGVEGIISEITNISPLFFDQFGNILDSLTAGWTVQYSDEEYIDSIDGRKVIRKVTGYVGGTGTLPTELSDNVGKYFAKAGGFTTSKADATIYETSELLIKEAKQGSAPTPYDAVNYPDGLFEKYQVKLPLTMPNSWGFAVTQAELDANNVFFDVTNGVVSKVLSAKLGAEISNIVDSLDEVKAVSGKAIADYLETGGTANPIGSLQSFGDTAFTDEIGSSAVIAYYILVVPFTDRKYLENIDVSFKGSGNCNFVIGHINTSNQFIEDELLVKSVVPGINNIIINRFLEVGQYIGIKTPGHLCNINTAKVNNYFQCSEGSYTDALQVGLSYNLALKINVKNGSIVSGYAKKKEVYTKTETKDILSNGLIEIGVEQITGSITKSGYYTSEMLTPPVYIFNKYVYNSIQKITKLSIDIGSAGSITFAIGSLDQANKFIERKLITKTAVIGVNDFSVDELLYINEYIAIKTPSPQVAYRSDNSGLYFLTDGYTSPATPIPGLILPLKITSNDYNLIGVVKKSEFDLLSIDFNILKNKVANFIAPSYSRVLHFGNSIADHQLASYWWGTWGMAASTRANDYVHKFLAKIQVKTPTATTKVKNIAAWEIAPSTFDKTTLNSEFTFNPDLVVVRLGENATWDANYRTNFLNLINYIKSQAPTAAILIGGTFWYSANKDNDMQSVAIELDIPFASMGGLDITENKSFIGAIVSGDDGMSHTVDNVGVANHPGDLGMHAIAERLFNSL